ncbi:MAG TPA: MFS transporter [Geminicoccus sp.]|uniref:MFS transporter n=1 Tax=Geminicoccus sp. TaxID=2024832 RepID=UPI002C842826|nr:MFS transporter [Geminicoccus sp.]HWL71754.1 MFS transporter [Geminicoccus sp.]
MADRLVFVVILMASVFAMAQGLSYPLLAFILERQGVPPALIGLNTAMTPIGIIASSPLIPWFARRLGAAWLALCSALALAALLLTIGAWQSLPVWFVARFLLGFVVNGLFVTSETWVNLLAPPDRRGRLLGIFASSLSAGFALGPFTLTLTGTEGWPPFLVGVVVFLATALILFLARRRLPEIHGGHDGGEHDGQMGSVLAFLPLAPFLLLSIGVVAAFDQSVLALLPSYGMSFGMPETSMATALGILIVGNILFQIPIGWLADRWSRRGTSLLLCGLTVLGALLLPLVIRTEALTYAMFFLWGSAAFGLYTVALIELGERFTGSMLLAGNAAFSLMWGIGGMVGPPLAGLAMTGFGPNGLPLAMGALYLLVMVTGAVPARLSRAGDSGRP